MTGFPLSLDDDLHAYARRLADLHTVQRQAGELMSIWHEGAGAMAMTLAHEYAAEAARIRGELARWVAHNLPTPVPMPVASLDLADSCRPCEHICCAGSGVCIYDDELTEERLRTEADA